MLLGLVQYMLPFAVLMLAPALTAVPEEIELASASLGASGWRTFRHVVLPLAKPGLVAAAVVVFTLTLTDFAMPEIMGGGRQRFRRQCGLRRVLPDLADAGLGGALAIALTWRLGRRGGRCCPRFGLGTLGYVQSDGEGR